MIVPGVAIFITVLAFNLFGDGLRDALDPKGTAERTGRGCQATPAQLSAAPARVTADPGGRSTTPGGSSRQRATRRPRRLSPSRCAADHRGVRRRQRRRRQAAAPVRPASTPPPTGVVNPSDQEGRHAQARRARRTPTRGTRRAATTLRRGTSTGSTPASWSTYAPKPGEDGLELDPRPGRPATPKISDGRQDLHVQAEATASSSRTARRSPRRTSSTASSASSRRTSSPAARPT